jgi:hypothetical protein
MIIEKRRFKTFNRNINRLKSAGSGIPSLMSKGSAHVDFLKKHQNVVISSVPVPENASDEALDQYESEMYDSMLAILKEETEAYELPAVQEEIQSMLRILGGLNSFKKKITKEKPDYDHEKFDGWSGINLFISAQPSDLKMEEYGDTVILAVNPRPIVWLMHTLKDICSEYLSFANKYEFYYGIAHLAQKHLDDLDEMSSVGETQFFMEGIRFAQQQVENNAERLSWLLIEFESFWNEREV